MHASIGTYTQEDPIGLAGGLNLYGFAGGDPVNFSDPFGLKGDCWTLECLLRMISRLALKELGTSPEKVESRFEAGIACGSDAGVAAVSSVSDVTTVAGVGKVVVKGALAWGGGRVARNLALDEVTRDLAPAAIKESNALVGEGVAQGARAIGRAVNTCGGAAR